MGFQENSKILILFFKDLILIAPCVVVLGDDEQPIPNRHLALSDPAEEDVGQIDLRSSVSIGSRDFRRIVLEFANDDLGDAYN